MRFLVGTCLLLAALLPVLRAQLNTREKQLALDVHNDLRSEEAMRQGVTNMREMQWDKYLADAARDHASGCYFVRKQTGQNLYIKSAESLTMLEVIEQWYSEGDGAGGCRDGVDSCDNYTRIVSAVTYRLGCDSALCPSLALPRGERMTNVTLIVCNYAPSYLSTPVYSTTADCPPHTYQLGDLEARGTLCVDSDKPPVIHPGTGNLNNIVRRNAANFDVSSSGEEVEQNVSSLTVLQQPANGTEGLPLSQQPVVAVIDDNGEIVQNLSVGMPWVLTASIETGPDGAFLTENIVNFTNGCASFTNLTLSHPGNYSLTFTVTYPPSADFSVMSEQFTVTERQLQFAISVQPEDGNTTRLLFPYPAVQINDLETGEVLTDPDWRNREWYVTASIEGVDDTWRAPLVDGEALFTEIAVSQPGTYQIQFSASTEPSSPSNQLPSPVNSDNFTIEQLPLTRVISTYDADFNEVVGDDTASFTNSFVAQIQPEYPNIEIFDVNATCGSIIVSFFATASTSSELTSFVSQVTSNNSALSFTFNGSQLTPVSIEQDPEFSVTETTTMPTPMTTEATTVSIAEFSVTETTTMPAPMTTEATTVSIAEFSVTETTTMPAPMTTEATTVSIAEFSATETTTMPAPMTTEATTVSPTTTMPAPMTTEATTVSIAEFSATETTTMPAPMTTEATTVSPTTTMPAPMTTEATTVSPTTTMPTQMMPVTLPTQMTVTQDNARLILGTVLPGSIILLIAILIIVAALLIQRHHKKTKTLKITVPREGEIEGRYAHIVQNLEVSGYDDESMDEFRLVPDHRVGVMETELSEPHEESAKEIVSKFVFTNPAAEATDTGISNLDLQESLEEIFNRNGSADDNNNNNNNNNSNVDFSPEHTSYRLAHAD